MMIHPVPLWRHALSRILALLCAIAAIVVLAYMVCGCGSPISNVDQETVDAGAWHDGELDGDPPADTSDPPVDAADALQDAGDDVALEAGGDAGGDAVAPPDAGESYVGGSRLRPRYAVTVSADGAESKRFEGWQDTARGEGCAFQTASDGAQRCLPSAAAPFGGTFWYSDATCTRAVWISAPSTCTTAVPKYTTPGPSLVSGTCPPAFGAAVFAVGGPIVPPATLYHQLGASCAAITPPTCAGAPCSFFDAGTEVPAASFVSATTSTVID